MEYGSDNFFLNYDWGWKKEMWFYNVVESVNYSMAGMLSYVWGYDDSLWIEENVLYEKCILQF